MFDIYKIVIVLLTALIASLKYIVVVFQVTCYFAVSKFNS